MFKRDDLRRKYVLFVMVVILKEDRGLFEMIFKKNYIPQNELDFIEITSLVLTPKITL